MNVSFIFILMKQIWCFCFVRNKKFFNVIKRTNEIVRKIFEWNFSVKSGDIGGKNMSDLDELNWKEFIHFRLLLLVSLFNQFVTRKKNHQDSLVTTTQWSNDTQYNEAKRIDCSQKKNYYQIEKKDNRIHVYTGMCV